MDDESELLGAERSDIPMVLGMSLQAFTLIHVLISLTGIASGLVVMYGFFANKRLDG